MKRLKGDLKMFRYSTTFLAKAGLACFSFILLLSNPAYAQNVSKIIADKGWVLASFKDASVLSVGQSACLLDTAGTTVACGKVIKVAKTVVVIKTSPISAAAQVKPGFKVEAGEGDSAAKADAASAAGGKKTAKTSKTATTSKSAGRSRIRFYSGMGLGVASISKVGYKAPGSGETGVKLWESQSTPVNFEKIGFGAEFETSRAGTFGFRLAVMGDAKPQFASTLILETDYDQTNRQKYVSSEHTHTVMGIYYDYAFLQPAPSKSGLRIFSGLDLVNSVAKFTGILKNEADSSDTEIATLDSTLSVISLRTGLEFLLRFGRTFEMGLGLRLAVPLAGIGLKQETTINDPNIAKSSDEQKDLKDALTHKKNTFGAVIPLSMSIAF
ncbi:MAG: hypothetical protein RIQ81_428 [Pseudomonadota bacterium]|jgi:hypothetical protein